jgi:hypothetical protein
LQLTVIRHQVVLGLSQWEEGCHYEDWQYWQFHDAEARKVED